MEEEFDYKFNKAKNPFVSDPDDPPKGQLAYEKEPTICTKCIFYQQRQLSHTCIAKLRKVTDFVTGKQRLRGIRACKDANTDGKCPDYKEKTE